MSQVDALHARTQGAIRQPDGSVLWRLWAPLRSEVTLVTWPDGKRVETPMRNEGEGYFSYQVDSIPDGLRYVYRVNGVGSVLPDPASRWQPDGVHQPSAVFTPGNFQWHDDGWRGVPAKDLVIYELHVGTFTTEGTFAAVIPRLGELKDLGITAIEIMPISQFPGARNWGYDGVHPYAAQNTYGGPRGFQELVDAAHQVGLGVLLDCVYNHLGPEGNYLPVFGHYFTDRYHTPWGKALNYDDSHSDPVRKFVVDNARYWIREFHLDGLRLDAVQTILDTSAHHLLAEIQEGVQEEAAAAGRAVHVIGETNQNDTRLTNPPEAGGYGLSGVWTDDFHHCLHSLLTGEKEGYYSDFGPQSLELLVKAFNEVFSYGGNYSPFYARRHGCRAGNTPREKFTVCIQNHDQIGNRARGERLSALAPPAALRAAASLMLVSPFTPLLFMGEEYAEDRPFAFFCSFLDPGLAEAVRQGRQREFAVFKWGGKVPDPTATATFGAARLQWAWPEGSVHAGVRNLYRHLLHARKQWPALREVSTNARLGSPGEPALVLERGQQEKLLIWANLKNEPASVQLPATDTCIFSSEEQRFAGERTSEQLPSTGETSEMLPWEVLIFENAAANGGSQ